MKTKKMLRKTLAIFMAVCAFASVVSAAGERTQKGDTEIVIDGINDGINEDESETTRNILCTFGHKKASYEDTQYGHRHYPTSPRCIRAVLKITYCTRSGCSYTTGDLVSSERIFCCS